MGFRLISFLGEICLVVEIDSPKMFDLCLSTTRRDGETGSGPNKRFLVSRSRRLPRRLDDAELVGVDGVGLGVLYPLVPLTPLLWPFVPRTGGLCPLMPLATVGVTEVLTP